MKSKYKLIYENYKSKIDNKILKPGASLPSEREITETYGVSRDTVRKAMQMLEHSGYISKQRGRESVVRTRSSFDFPIARIVSFKEMAKQLQWTDVVTIVEDLSIVEADDELILKLDAEKGE